MKAALTEWQGRIAPVFDVAGTVLIFETEPEGESREESMAMPTDSPQSKLTFLKARQIDVLICGAVSQFLAALICDRGIEMIPLIKGRIPEVLEGYLIGNLSDTRFMLPGALPGIKRGRRRRCRLRGKG